MITNIEWDKDYKLNRDRLGYPKGTIVKRYDEWDFGLSANDTEITGIKHYSVKSVGMDEIVITVTLDMLDPV